MDEYGFVYIWFDRKKKRYYIGSHWGTEDDGYICSSDWMLKAKQRRPEDFKRRIISRVYTNREDTFLKEQEWLDLVKPHEIKHRYYNLHIKVHHWTMYPELIKTIGQKISLKKTGISTGPCTEEKRQKIIAATTGIKKTYTPETYQALINSRTGRKHTEEWKQENSQRLSQQWANGTRRGHSQSEESNKKRSETSKGKCYTQPTDQSRKAQSEARKALWADPVYRQKMTEIRRKRKSTT